MRIAAIMPGNLGNYKLCIESIMKNLIGPNKADVFILAAKENNYFHLAGDDTLHGGKYDYPVSESDEEEIQECFGSQLKSIEYIEDIPDYKEEMAKQIKLLNKRVLWWDDLGKWTHFFDSKKREIRDGRNYLDRFLRMKYLIKTVEDYESKNNMKYDYIIRFRIEQLFNDPIVIEHEGPSEEFHFMGSGMDCFWHGTAKTAKYLALNAVSEVGRFDNNSITPAGDYRFDRDMQFSELIKTLSDVNSKPMGLQIGITLFKENLKIFIPDQATEVDRKENNKSLTEYYGGSSCEQKYPIIDHYHRYIWVYTYFRRK